jgi:Fic family protein
MRHIDFQSRSPGQLIKNLQGRLTFVPNPLPPSPKLSLLPSLLRRIGVVDNTLGRLDGKAQSLPDRKILIRSFVRREAQLSSYIENTYARYDEVAAAEQTGRREDVADQVWETLNAEIAINAGVQAVFDKGRPITLSLIRQMHSLLLDNVRGHETRGRFRDVQVYIGNREEDVESARFVPAPPHMVVELMDRLQLYLPADENLPAVVQLALLHYQFEAIHPFEDGNGRLGRIMILLGLCQYKLLTVPLLNASLHFERNRREYYDTLLRVSTHGDWNGWIAFFVEGLEVAAKESMQKLTELCDLQSDYHDRLRSARNSALLLTLIDNLFVTPVITVSNAMKLLGLSYPSAQGSVQKLIAAGILTEIKPRKLPARFVASAILKAVNAEPSRR